MEWQQLNARHWVLGNKVRGIVHNPVAEVTCTREFFPDRANWSWWVDLSKVYSGYKELGTADQLLDAIKEVERLLGIKDE